MYSGVLANTFREYASNPNDDRKWILFDGPVDAVWIENMNTVLDDNKKVSIIQDKACSYKKSFDVVFALFYSVCQRSNVCFTSFFLFWLCLVTFAILRVSLTLLGLWFCVVVYAVYTNRWLDVKVYCTGACKVSKNTVVLLCLAVLTLV